MFRSLNADNSRIDIAAYILLFLIFFFFRYGIIGSFLQYRRTTFISMYHYRFSYFDATLKTPITITSNIVRPVGHFTPHVFPITKLISYSSRLCKILPSRFGGLYRHPNLYIIIFSYLNSRKNRRLQPGCLPSHM